MSNLIDTWSHCLALLWVPRVRLIWLQELLRSVLTQVLSSPLAPMWNMYAALFLSVSQPQSSKFSLCFSSVYTFQPLWQIFWHQKRHAFPPSFDFFKFFFLCLVLPYPSVFSPSHHCYYFSIPATSWFPSDPISALKSCSADFRSNKSGTHFLWALLA